MRISDWSSDVCSSDLLVDPRDMACALQGRFEQATGLSPAALAFDDDGSAGLAVPPADAAGGEVMGLARSEEHTAELQSLMRIPYAVFCLKKKKSKKQKTTYTTSQALSYAHNV